MTDFQYEQLIKYFWGCLIEYRDAVLEKLEDKNRDEAVMGANLKFQPLLDFLIKEQTSIR